MSGYLEIVYSPEAEEQLQQLSDGDIRYSLEPESYEWMLARDPEGLGAPFLVENTPVYLFLTVKRANDLSQLLIAYVIDRAKAHVLILDIRPAW